MSKPTEHIDWTDGNSSKVQEPPTGKKDLGWTGSEKPPFEWMNWLFYVIDQWLKYFESITDTVLANGTVYDAIIGVGGTHGSFDDYELDVDKNLKKNILVISPFTLTQPINLTGNDLNIDFKPQAIISKGTSTQGIVINGERVRLRNAHFINFGASNDEALRLENTTKNIMVRDCFFTNCDITIKDNGVENSLSGNVEA